MVKDVALLYQRVVEPQTSAYLVGYLDSLSTFDNLFEEDAVSAYCMARSVSKLQEQDLGPEQVVELHQHIWNREMNLLANLMQNAK
jgi:hypothetical protein